MNYLFLIIPRRPRWLNKIIAYMFGYFWLPCPLCGESFAGYEWLSGHTIHSGSRGEGVCYKAKCKKEADELSICDYIIVEKEKNE